MSYQQFLSEITSEVQRRSGVRSRVRIRRVLRTNDVSYDGISITENDQKITPHISLEPYYVLYRKGTSIEELASEIIYQNQVNFIRNEQIPEDFHQFSSVKSSLSLRLVNREWNKELLYDKVSLPFLDLALLFCFDVEIPDERKGSIYIRRDDLNDWGISLEDLQAEAMKQMKKRNPPQLFPIAQVLRESGVDLADLSQEEEVQTLTVLTNEQRLYGASCLIYPELLKQESERRGTDLYILPSSVHEVLLMSCTDAMRRDELEQMVQEINRTQVAPWEVLSDHVYVYRREDGVLL